MSNPPLNTNGYPVGAHVNVGSRKTSGKSMLGHISIRDSHRRNLISKDECLKMFRSIHPEIDSVL